MIRPFTCLCLAAACGSGLYLYSEKHRTAMLDRDISQIIHQTEAARARTGLLRAEWALLNEPGRLQDMSDKYLTLKPMAPTQFVQLADLPSHLPAPMATTAAGNASDEDDQNSAAPALDATTPVAGDPAPPLAQTDPLPAKQIAPEPPAPPKQIARVDPKPTHPTHHVLLVDRQYGTPHDGMLAHGTPLPLAAPQPMGASVYSALARPMRQQTPRATVVAAVPRYATPFAPSALGGRATLPPPTPYGAGEQ
jgi:hypothetical protein